MLCAFSQFTHVHMFEPLLEYVFSICMFQFMLLGFVQGALHSGWMYTLGDGVLAASHRIRNPSADGILRWVCKCGPAYNHNMINCGSFGPSLHTLKLFVSLSVLMDES